MIHQKHKRFSKLKQKHKKNKKASATEIAAQQQAIKHETNDTLKAPSNKKKDDGK